MIWLRWLVRFLLRLVPWLSADYRRRIKPRCKCPACGNVRKQAMVYDARQGFIVLTCVECAASWGYETIIKPARWAKPQERA